MSNPVPAQPAFDDNHPPSAELIADCVHCGFCLPTCPTYVLWGEEADSPRGRIYLMKSGLEGDPLSDSMVRHFDACLGCLACTTACPSGVQYGALLEATRAQVERRYERPRSERLLRALLFGLFPYPRRLRALRPLLALQQRTGLQRRVESNPRLRRLAPGLSAMAALAPPIVPAQRLPRRVPATGERRLVVGLLTGCVQSVFFSEVNAATVRVLAAEGCDVVIPGKQRCCGALSMHAGRVDEARRFARQTIDLFDRAGVNRIVVNAAGCGSTMKDYVDLLARDHVYAARAAYFAGKVRDIAELLDELGPVARRHPLPVTVAYHDSCHLAHAQGVRRQPRNLLSAIPGLELREIAEAELCCGSAGIYNIVQPEPAAELGDRKAANVAATGAELLVSANPGCLLQLAKSLDRRGAAIATAHTIEVLDASIRGIPPSTLMRHA